MEEDRPLSGIRNLDLEQRIALRNARPTGKSVSINGTLENLDQKGVKTLAPDGRPGPHTPAVYKIKSK